MLTLILASVLPPPPSLLQQHIKDPLTTKDLGHSAKSAGGRLAVK